VTVTDDVVVKVREVLDVHVVLIVLSVPVPLVIETDVSVVVGHNISSACSLSKHCSWMAMDVDSQRSTMMSVVRPRGSASKPLMTGTTINL
jgi:hypothetical protein